LFNIGTNSSHGQNISGQAQVKLSLVGSLSLKNLQLGQRSEDIGLENRKKSS
jgi:hypothetical protein